jgi:hypothetical protein
VIKAADPSHFDTSYKSHDERAAIAALFTKIQRGLPFFVLF